MVLDRARRQPFIAQALSVLLAPAMAARSLVARTVALGVRSSSGGNTTAAPTEEDVTAELGSASSCSDDRILVLDSVAKRYGALVAVDAISLDVRQGEIFGILGPNGAGKTTTLEMIEGLRVPDGGCITIFGMPALRQRRRVQQLMGVQLQSQTLWQELTAVAGADSRGDAASLSNAVQEPRLCRDAT